jgi:hypothetical protein
MCILYLHVCMNVHTMFVCMYIYVCTYACMYYICTRVYVLRMYTYMHVYIYVYIRNTYVLQMCVMYVCTDWDLTKKIPINTIGKVFRNRTGYVALPVPRPTGSGYREFDPQSQILKASSLVRHNHLQVLGFMKSFHTVQCSRNKPPSKISKSTARRQWSRQYKCRPTSFATLSRSFFERSACN